MHAMTSPDHDLQVQRPWTLGPRSGAAVLCILLPALLVLEWISGTAFSLHLFYLVPVSLAAWNFGQRVGVAVAAMAAAYCVFVAIGMRPPLAPVLPFVAQCASVVAMFLLFAFAIDHHRRFVDAVIEASRLDFESGAVAQREFDRVLDTEARRARRYARPLSLLMCEMPADGEGSEPRAVVETLRGHVRECDVVGRGGRRRLVLMLVECPMVEARRVAERAREVLAQAFPKARYALGVVSYGGSSPTNAGQLLHMAEAQIARAKAALSADAPLAQAQLA